MSIYIPPTCLVPKVYEFYRCKPGLQECRSFSGLPNPLQARLFFTIQVSIRFSEDIDGRERARRTYQERKFEQVHVGFLSQMEYAKHF